MANSLHPRPPPTARGVLTRTPLAHLFVYATEHQLSGTLELASPSGERAALALAAGEVTKVRLSEPVAHLGRVMLELGMIDDAELNASLHEVARTRRLHGQVLLEAGHIDQTGLERALNEQLARKVRHLFTFSDDTEFAYTDRFDALADFGGEAVVHADLLPITWRGVCEIPRWEHVHAVLGQVRERRIRLAPAAALARFDFDRDERTAAELLRARPMTIAELETMGVLRPRTTQLLVYCLIITKQAEGADEGSASAVAARSGPEHAQRLSPSMSAPALLRSSHAGINAPSTAAAPGGGSPNPGTDTASLGAPALWRASHRPDALDPELSARRNEALELCGHLATMNHYELLGVAPTVTNDELRTAFFELAKRWHPDRIPAPLSGLRLQWTSIFSHMSEAHQTLVDANRRRAYDGQHAAAPPASVPAMPDSARAAAHLQRAEACLRRGDLETAEKFCGAAQEADPNHAESLALSAWIAFQKANAPTVDATLELIKKLDRAIELNAQCAAAYLYRGRLQLRIHNQRSALRDFRRAVDINPHNVDAQREVRLFARRHGNDAQDRVATAGKDRRDSLGPPSARGRGPSLCPAPPTSEEPKGLFQKLLKR